MKKMPETNEFCKRSEAIVVEMVEVIRKLAVETENITDLDVRIRVETGRIARELIGVALTERGGKKTYGTVIECACGGRAKFKQNRPHVIGTVLPGKDVNVLAAYYVCETCHKGITPLLDELRTDGDGATTGLQELIVLAGAIEPYREAAENLLRKFAGVQVSGTRVRTKAVEEGEAVEEYLNGELETVTALESDELLHVEIDGGMIHSEGRWQEVKLCVISGEKDRIEISEGRGMLMRRDVVAVRGSPEDLAGAMEPRISGHDPYKHKAVVLADGAKWIWNLAEDLFPNRIEILDYYHAVEHLWSCATTLFGEMSGETENWVDEQKDRLMNDEVEEIIEALRQLHARIRAPAKRKAVNSLLGYLQNNMHRMRYKSFLDAGYRIGSGTVESAIKHVVQMRMKCPGMRWQNPGADSMLALRCLYRSTGRWNDYWNDRKQPKQAA